MEVTLEGVRAQLAEAVGERERIGEQLSAARHQAAPRLADAVRSRLAELSMADAQFEVALHEREGGPGGSRVRLRRVFDRAERRVCRSDRCARSPRVGSSHG